MATHQTSAQIIQSVLDRKGDVKTLLYQQSGNKKVNPAVYALVNQTVRYKAVIEEVIASTPNVNQQFQHRKNERCKGMILLLVYELLFGKKKRISSPSLSSKRFTRLILANKSALHSALVRIKIKRQISNDADLMANNDADTSSSPGLLYARINTFLVNNKSRGCMDVIQTLIEEHKFAHFASKAEFEATDDGDNDNGCRRNCFWRDGHMPELLVFTGGCKIAKLSLCINGYVIIQNKSSCMPAFVMQPRPDWCVLDACASPGNKTSHLLCLMSDAMRRQQSLQRPCIVALDRDAKRARTLQERMNLFGMKEFIDVRHTDFLSIEPTSPFALRFNAILLDPTCSGSGLVRDRIAHYDEHKKLKVPMLSALQKKMISHAMQFGNVKRIVYSTCSVHTEENEEVIAHALQHGTFECVKIFEEWKHRGHEQYEFGQNVVRVNNENRESLHGFFVACLQRKILAHSHSQQDNENKKRKRNHDSREDANQSNLDNPPRQKQKLRSKKWSVPIKTRQSYRQTSILSKTQI